MVQEEALKPIIELLNILKIPYMLVGAMAVNYYSVPRLTHDADLVVQMHPMHIDNLVKALEDKYYADEEMIKEALESFGQFNLIHFDTGFKIDFWILQKDEFSQQEFSRRVPGKVFGQDVFLISPEDLILNKLCWFKDSDVQKHFLDAVGVYRVQKEILDMDYLYKKAKLLNLTEILKKLEEQA